MIKVNEVGLLFPKMLFYLVRNPCRTIIVGDIDAVMPLKLTGNLTGRMISTKIGNDPLQWLRNTQALHTGGG